MAHKRFWSAPELGRSDGRGVRRGRTPCPTRGHARTGSYLCRCCTSCGVVERLRRDRLRRDLPASRKTRAASVHRRVRFKGVDRAMSRKKTSDLWWKNAVIYCMDVETFLDADGDGCGDFVGLTERIDYLAGLGVACIWLMPYNPSPQLDDGYDITDFYGIDERFGTPGDFVEMVRTARDRGIRVIVDVVLNHTSDQHPWFQEARKDTDPPYHDFYVWADEKPPDPPGGVVFPDKEDSNWAYDEEAGRWFFHRFYSHQPELNVANPAVRDELAQIMGYWLEQGISGFRIDAVPFLIETEGLPEGAIAEPHELVRDLRSYVSRHRGDVMLLGEVGLPPEELVAFYGEQNGDELHMCFNFSVNQAMWQSLARGDATPLAEALRALPDIPDDCQWGNFVRNHDELTLEQLSEDERAEIFDIEGRMGLRAPMQWSDEPHGGFTTGDPKLVRPVVASDRWGPSAINVADQRRQEDSLLNWMERLIRRRRESPEIGWGHATVLDIGEKAVLAHRCDWGENSVVAVHSFSEDHLEVTFPADGSIPIKLEPYAHRWFRMRKEGQRLPP